MVDWYYRFITHRNMYIDINGHSSGVCSAKFWIVAFNAAISILNEHGVLGLGFADDCVALIGGTNLHQMISRVQKVITKLEEWGLTCGLTFNPSKTVVVIFTKKQISVSQQPNKLQVGGLSVPFTHSAKYLGVILDSKFTWNLHFTTQITKCKKYLHMLQKGVKKHGGPSQHTLDMSTQLSFDQNLPTLPCHGVISLNLLANTPCLTN